MTDLETDLLHVLKAVAQHFKEEAKALRLFEAENRKLIKHIDRVFAAVRKEDD